MLGGPKLWQMRAVQIIEQACLEGADLHCMYLMPVG